MPMFQMAQTPCLVGSRKDEKCVVAFCFALLRLSLIIRDVALERKSTVPAGFSRCDSLLFFYVLLNEVFSFSLVVFYHRTLPARSPTINGVTLAIGTSAQMESLETEVTSKTQLSCVIISNWSNKSNRQQEK